jgi:hypothetical protein
MEKDGTNSSLVMGFCLDPQIPHMLSDLRVPHEVEGKLCFYFKCIQNST